MEEERDLCPHAIQPFPYEFCGGCALNGCYPWNTNSLLLCSGMGGLLPAIVLTEEKDGIESQHCASFSLVTEKSWESHLKDLKHEAASNEEWRRRAMDGAARSNHLLPAEKARVAVEEREFTNKLREVSDGLSKTARKLRY